jgi:asparagine synthase (glutamine-hydrolysing)
LTILAGVFRRRNDFWVTDRICDEIEQSISRNSSDKPITFRNSRVFLAKIDIGVYGQDASIIDSDGCVSLLAGEPLLLVAGANSCNTRDEDLKILHSAWKSENWNLLERARGVFCAAHFSSVNDRLTLISDKLGIRSLYYYLSEDYVIFCTALRILESLPTIKKAMDLRGVAEIATLGYPLSTRTPYQNVFCLQPSEIIHFRKENISYSQYFRWDTIPISRKPEIELAREAYKRFSSAIRCRLRSDTATVAFLSGGLDSRCIVGLLRNRNVKAFTFNFSDQNTQDNLFAENFAQVARTVHTYVPMNGSPDYSRLISDAWSSSPYRLEKPVERPGLVWSGDGGSVGVGHVYMSKKILDLLINNDPDAAIGAFLADQHARLLDRLFRRSIALSLADCLSKGIREEFNDMQCEDPGRAFHIFLMQNDQRRHLTQHFENIDLHRMEFHLPFFDSYFLEWIMACPVELCLNHHFYNAWLECFPGFVRSVPWQTYPGHEPCPLPVPKGIQHQWQHNYLKDRRKAQKWHLIHQALDMLIANDFPHNIIKKSWLFKSTLIYSIGLRDYSYVIRTSEIVTKYSRICNNMYSL